MKETIIPFSPKEAYIEMTKRLEIIFSESQHNMICFLKLSKNLTLRKQEKREKEANNIDYDELCAACPENHECTSLC